MTHRRHLLGTLTLAAATWWLPVPAEAARPCEARSIAGGASGLCVVREDGRVACFGDELFSLPLSPAPAGRFEQVSIGAFYGCGAREDGTASCWGKWEHEPFPEPAGLFQEISVGYFEAWGLRPNGNVVLVHGGLSDPLPTPPSGKFIDIEGRCGRRLDQTVDCWEGPTPPGGTFEQLSGGCGVRTDGSLDCWDVSAEIEETPEGVFEEVAMSSDPFLAAGACARKPSGHVVCWGELGNPVPAETTFRAIAVGLGVPCGIRTDGSLQCWPDVFNSEFDTRPLEGTFVQVATGGDYTRPASCAVDVVGEIACWGNDQFGQSSPPAGPFQQVTVGAYHACGLRKDGTIDCWGENSTKDLEAPSGTFTQVSSGTFGPTCALRSNGEAECWGLGEFQLDVPDGPFEQVTAGGQRACALEPDGDPECWKYVEGPGGAIDMEAAQAPPGPFAQLSIALLDLQQNVLACGLRPGGSVECWRDGEEGMESVEAPDEDFTEVSAGAGSACGLRPDGTIACWGADGESFYPPPAGDDFVQVATGFAYCGLTVDGSIVCSGGDQTVSFCGPSPLCGNGQLDPAETCDDGDTLYEAGAACTASCSKVPCGQPLRPDAGAPTASDALFALRAAVGLASCDVEVCDVNDSSTISAADALRILRKSVGQPVSFHCPV